MTNSNRLTTRQQKLFYITVPLFCLFFLFIILLMNVMKEGWDKAWSDFIRGDAIVYIVFLGPIILYLSISLFELLSKSVYL